jgi:hypothetical protein
MFAFDTLTDPLPETVIKSVCGQCRDRLRCSKLFVYIDHSVMGMVVEGRDSLVLLAT